MADDVTYTSSSPAGLPNATKQVTDEHATRGHMPIVKLAYSADGDATPILADTNGLEVQLGLAIPAGDNNIGNVDIVNWVPKPLAYFWLIPSQVHVAVANTVHWDFFNADASLIVRVTSIKQIPNITTAVTGVVFDWLLERTTAVGTGGSALTAWLADTNDTALDADITARSKPSGGATQSTDLFNYSLSSEETNTATIQVASQGGLELVPEPLRPSAGGKGIVLRANQGLRCVQVTNSAAGNTGWLICFTVE